jgi:hypothetical protein
MANEPILEKLSTKLESVLDTLETKPLESIIKVILLYVVFKQLFKNKIKE